MNNKISIVITTKKFSKNLYKTINSIIRQSYSPKEIILVSNEKILKNFNLNNKITIKKFTSSIKNQVFQRNIGVNNISNKSDLILQLDDRIILDKNCLLELNKFWNKTNRSTVGVGLNHINTSNDTGLLNRLMIKFFDMKGKLLNNGFAIDYSDVKEDLEVMWLKGGLSSWKTKTYKKINNRKFPLWSWSVFEDVEFSLLKKKDQKLFVSHKSKARVIEREKKINIKNSFYRGTIHSYAQKRIVKTYLKSKNSFFIMVPFAICLSLIVSVFTFNISKFIYNLGRIRGFFIIHFN